MPELIFDTHAYVKKLKSVGFTEEQAEVQTETIATLINDEMVTKRYFDLRMAELGKDMAEQKSDLIKWVFGIAAGQTALIVTMLKLMK